MTQSKIVIFVFVLFIVFSFYQASLVIDHLYLQHHHVYQDETFTQDLVSVNQTVDEPGGNVKGQPNSNPSSGMIVGENWGSDQLCNGINGKIGFLTFLTDKCYFNNATKKYFSYYCNNTAVIFKTNCFDENCTQCTQEELPYNSCTFIDTDETGDSINAKLTCQSSFTFPEMKKNSVKFNFSTGCEQKPEQVYSTWMFDDTCLDQRKHSCNNSVYTISNYSDTSCVFLDQNFTTNLAPLTCNSRGGVFKIMTQCSTPVSSIQTSLSNITANYNYDQTCSTQTSSSGKVVIKTDVQHNQGFPFKRYMCDSNFIFERTCSDLSFSKDCSDKILENCKNSLNDESNSTFYLQDLKCSGSLNESANIVFTHSCQNNPLIYRYPNSDCISIKQTGSEKSTRYSCLNGTAVVSFFNQTLCPGEYFKNSTFKSSECLKTETKLLKCGSSASVLPPVDFTCFGYSRTSIFVCSGKGQCFSQDNCTCNNGTSGTQCQITETQTIAPNSTVFNSISFTLNKGDKLNFQGRNLTFIDSSLFIKGDMNISGTIIELRSSTLRIEDGGNLTISNNSMIRGFNGTFFSAGNVQVNLEKGSSSILVPIINNGNFDVNGEGSFGLSNSIQQSQKGVFTSWIANITVNGDLSIKNGKLNLGGTINSRNVNLNDSFVKVESLSLKGNLNLNSAIIFEVDSINSLNRLAVSESIKFLSTVFIKLSKNYNAALGDKFKPVSSVKLMFLSGKFILLGAGDKYTIKPSIKVGSSTSDIITQELELEVVYSIGTSSSTCHYMGFNKNLEFFVDEYISLSLIFPILPNNINFGVGWNKNSTFDPSLVVFFGKSFIQTPESNLIMDYSLRVVPQLFSLGPSYYYANLIVPKSIFENQTHMFYVETSNLQDLATVNAQSFKFQIGKDEVKDCTNFVFPFRAEIYNLGGTVFILVIYVIIFIISLIAYFFRRQPIYSRGLSPFLILFFCFAQLLTELRNYYYTTYEQASLCLFYSYLYYPSIQSCFIVILFYYIRYFLIINMNETKHLLKDHPQSFKYSARKIYLIKLFLSKWTVFLYLILSYALINLLFTIILASNNYVCSFKILTSIKIFYAIGLLVIYVAIIGTVIFDLVTNLQKIIKCRIFQYMFKSDPYWFRTQIYLFLMYLVYQFIADIVVISKTSSFNDYLTNYNLIGSLNTVTCLFLVLLDVLFPLFISVVNTILYIIFSFFKSQKTVDGLLKVLKDPNTFKMFENFCKTEYSFENISCYQDIKSFEAKPTMEKAQEIYLTYLMGVSSPMEVNVSRSHCAEVKILIDKNDITPNLFSKIEAMMITNLSDTFSRFIYLPEYINYEKLHSVQNELLEK